MATNSVIDFLKPDGPPMSEEEQKRAAKFIDQIDPVPANSDRMTVAVVREAIEAVQEFFRVPVQHLTVCSGFDKEEYNKLSDRKKSSLDDCINDASRAWKWIVAPKGVKFLLSFSDCMSHNGVANPELVRERTIEQLEKLGSDSHMSYLKGVCNVK